MTRPYDWNCSFCGRSMVVSSLNRDIKANRIDVGATKQNYLIMSYEAIRCTNPNCNELSLSVTLTGGYNSDYSKKISSFSEEWKLRPSHNAKNQPDYIPNPILEDYYEACKIKDLSPKASATLARRCLQGMIRDFCKVSKSRLVDEVGFLRNLIENGSAPRGVEIETVDAIDAVRNIGNIGAHMEKDISLIIEVDPGEAQALIELLELLFDEWYVARYNREKRLAHVKLIAAEKEVAIREGRDRLAEQKLPSVEEDSAS